YCREQGLFHTEKTPEARYTDSLELDLSTVEPSVAGPKRPQDRVNLADAGRSFTQALPGLLPPGGSAKHAKKSADALTHGSVVIAAITSCTNTSNPSVMVAAGLVAKAAVERGLSVKPWVKTSLAPGSQVVTEYYRHSGLDKYLEKL